MSPPELPTAVCAEHLTSLHRYACLLMGGDAAAAMGALDATLDGAAGRAGDIRCSRRAARWLFAEVRAQCRRRHRGGGTVRTESHPVDEDDFRRVAEAFATLPEPERAALALFYIGPFRRLELAETLGVRPDELGPLLQRARSLLGAVAAGEIPTAATAGGTATTATPPLPDGVLAAG